MFHVLDVQSVFQFFLPPRPVRPFHVRRLSLSLTLPHTALPPRRSATLLHHVHQSHGLCNALSSRHEDLRNRLPEAIIRFPGLSHDLAFDLELIVFPG